MAGSKRNKIREELEAIANSNSSILRPIDVVRWARKHPRSGLHGKFNWNMQAAAMQYWLWQAREIIAVHVEVIHQDHPETRIYVSLKEDRKVSGGGYRYVVDVLSDPERRAALLEEALREFKRFEIKYRVLKELAPVFSAMKRVKTRRKGGNNRPRKGRKRNKATV